MTREIIKFLFMGMIVAPLAILIGGGRLELALSVGFGFVVWIIVVYIITKPIEVIAKNKDNIKNAIKNNPINKNQQSLHTKTSQNQTVSKVNQNNDLENIHITPEEEEEMYAKVSKEFSENKKEGMWTKALIQSDGDENKAKIGYMKLRVEQLNNELVESKLHKENKKLLIIQKKKEKRENEIDKVKLFFDKHFPNNYFSVGTIKKLEFLIEYAKKNKIEGQALILTSHIKYMVDDYHYKPKNDIFLRVYDKLNQLVLNSKSETISVSLVEEIYNEHRWN